MEMQNNKLEELIQTQNEILQQIIASPVNESFIASEIKNAETQIRCILDQLGNTAQSYRDTALVELEKELKQKYSDEVKELEAKHDTELRSIQDQNAEEVKKSYAQGCSDTTVKKNDEIEQLRISLNNEKNKELSDFEKEFSDEIQSLIANHEKQKNELAQQIEEKNKAELDKFKADYEKKIAEYEEKLDEFEKNKNEFKETLKTEYEEKISDLTEKLETVTKELDTYKKSNGELVDRFDVITDEYGKVLDQLFACKSMESYRIKNKLEAKEKGSEAIIHFIKIVGNNFMMARDIRDAMQRYRKNVECCPLMDDELKLINIVNEFYRKEHKREDENDKVLFLPENCDNPSSMVRFNPSQMQDLEHPAETKYKSIKCIYAPCFRQYDENRIEKAIVKASEDSI